MDVVIDAEQVALQLHESVGHPTELDRVLGFEAAYAGTSFLHPSDRGSLRYGSEHMNVTSDPTTPRGLGTFGFDDEGVPAEPQPIVREGVLVGWLGSREVGFPGSMRADGWSRMPLVRMTNLHLEPGEGTLEELIAGVERGIFLETNKSWSIDDKRLNFQFGTQVAWEIVDGKLGRMFRDATYTGITPQFWGSMDAVGRPRRVAAARADELRQGTARAGGARLARHVAGPLPRRAGRGSSVSTRSRSRAARSKHAAAAADEAERLVHSERSGLARFAGSTQHQPTLVDDTVVTLRAVRDGRVGVAVTNRTSDDGLREVAARAADAAERVREDPDFPGLAEPADPPQVDGYDEETAALGPDEQAQLAAAAIAATGDTPAYGFFTSGVTELAVVSTTGSRRASE